MFKIIFCAALLIALCVKENVMPYPPEHKHDTRQRILDSARRLFNKRGFNEVSIEDVMSNAGLTHGGFYRYFSGKDELYADAVRQFLCGQAPEPWQIAQRDRCVPGTSRAPERRRRLSFARALRRSRGLLSAHRRAFGCFPERRSRESGIPGSRRESHPAI
jgi:AcrR family transcriptional regulator